MNSSRQVRSVLPPNLKQCLRHFPSLFTIPVQWGESEITNLTSQMTIARWFESGRVRFYEEFVSSCTGSADVLKGVGFGPIIKSISITNHGYFKYPGTVVIASRVNNVEKDRWIHETLLGSIEDDKVFTTCKAIAVGYDHTNKRKMDIPTNIAEAFKSTKGE